MQILMNRMKYLNAFWVFVFFVSRGACKKETIITSPDVSLLTSTDLVHFDTVFTSVGSITQSFTIVNDNDQQLNISSIQNMLCQTQESRTYPKALQIRQ